MNRNTIYFLLIFIPSLLAILGNSHTRRLSYSGKRTNSYPLKNIELCIRGTSISFPAHLVYLSENENLGILRKSLASDTFDQITSYLSNLNSQDRDSKTQALDKAALILYYDIPRGADRYDIQDINLRGYSTYSFHSRRLYHQFFFCDRDGSYQWYPNLSAYTSSIYCSHPNQILSTVTDDALPFRAHILLSNHDGWDLHPKFTRDHLSDRIEKFQDEFWLLARD